ncbi:MAG: 23S rRNA (guanosine(2251)-2'-O)-methyltransferase RlmB [Spirochaetaceae bacterium]|nr:23S rRNA (guanosine(2251)-2'-O)-methyltransferase RlmB [Spirochaetaceae bacterium]
MADRVITGFHAVEEFIRSSSGGFSKQKIQVLYTNPGPRVKKILTIAKAEGIQCIETPILELDKLVASFSGSAKEHRGLVLKVHGEEATNSNSVLLEDWLNSVPEQATVVVLDSITDPHNVGAIIRSCDQLGANLIIMPERRGVKDVVSNEVVARASAGASSWVKIAQIPNLSRGIQMLKTAGFWIYGADAGGISATEVNFSERRALVMGSEGSGISRLLQEHCDVIVSIPTCGRLDSLNVSVATGILLYEVRRQSLVTKCN